MPSPTDLVHEMPTPDSFTCCLVGARSLLIRCGDALRREGHRVVAVASRDPAVREWAEEAEIGLVDSPPELLAVLAGRPPDVLFAIGHLAVLSGDVLRLPRRAAINFHDGPLPEFAGLNTPAWGLLRGVPRWGVSWHLMTAGVDEGDLLVERRFDIAADETSLTLNSKCFEAASAAFEELIAGLATEEGAAGKAQDLAHRRYFGRCDRPPSAGVLDPARSAEELARQVRALDFGRYENRFGVAKLVNADAAIRVVAATAEAAAGGRSGEVLRLDDTALRLATADGVLRVTQLEGLAGEELSPVAAADRLGLGLGDVLAPVDGEAWAAVDAELCPHEPFWSRRLASLVPLAAPRLGTPTEAAASGWHEVPIALPPALAERGVDAIVAACLAALARLVGTARGDVADHRGAARGADGSALVAPWVPLRLRLDAGGDAEAALTALVAELETTRRRRGFLRDLVGRLPELRDAVPPVTPPPVALIDIGPPPADAELALFADGGGARWLASPRVYGASSARRLAAACERFAAGLIDDPARSFVARQLADPAPPRGEAPSPPETTVWEELAAQASKTPEATALVAGVKRLSYRDLHHRARTLAVALLRRGVTADDRVGIAVERSADLVVAVLGVLAAGGAYVPLDPDDPEPRRAAMIEDAGIETVVVGRRAKVSLPAGSVAVPIGDSVAADPETPLPGPSPKDLAYVLYTSGSTGRPKGVMVEHRQVTAFFAALDALELGPPGVFLAVTRLSFDISVLELLWTLARGFTVVVDTPEAGEAPASAPPNPAAARPVEFGLFYFASNDPDEAADGGSRYRLLLEGARFADAHGFSSVWTPERHFHAFGGLYPNPAVAGAALAAVTENLRIMAGSCVLPLHHPARIAEEWAVVDNLSHGRVGVSFASGWQPDDFVLRPEAYADRHELMWTGVEQVRRLWRGEELSMPGPKGGDVTFRSLPRPVQGELPVWITSAGNVETWRRAGEIGANLLTHLLGQSVAEVGDKIAVYREARAAAGPDPDAGRVTLMLHTFVGDDVGEIRELVREPLRRYLASSVGLIKKFAWEFPAFSRPAGEAPEIDLGSLDDEEMNALLDHAFERYFATSGLFGTPESCLPLVDELRRVGVDEIGCLIDFGVPADAALAALEPLDRLRRLAAAPRDEASPAAAGEPAASGAALPERVAVAIAEHGVTHLQVTPSLARGLLAAPSSRTALGRLRRLLVGGEALPTALLEELQGALGDGVGINLYGPTEATVWATVEPFSERRGTAIGIGRPLDGVRAEVVDRWGQPVPDGIAGELVLGGPGVARGYLGRPRQTAAAFVADPSADGGGERRYRTGDLARRRADGSLEFLGRLDHQVKIRGHRVELGEIEASLEGHAAVAEAVAVAREETPGDVRVLAWVVAAESSEAELRRHVRGALPAAMVPARIVVVDRLPRTPNGKLDRKALPEPEAGERTPSAPVTPLEGELEERIADVWRRLLGVERLGAGDNFFDLGGHSLLAVQAHQELRRSLGRALSLTDLFRFPTVRALATHLAGNGDPGGETGRRRGADRAALRRARRLNR